MQTKLNRSRDQLLESKRNREKQNDAEIQGEITGAIYRNGPVLSRNCTDTFFCVLYVIFLCFLLSITIVGYLDGDVRYLYTGYDTDYQACGVKELANYPYLYFASPGTNTSLTVCVESCPENSSSTLECYANSAVANCSTDAEVYATNEYNGVVCVPTDSTTYSEISGLLSQGYWQDLTQIFEDNWMTYLTALGFSYALTTILLLLMLFFPRCVTWTFIISSITLILLAASLFMILYANPELLSNEITSNASGLSDNLKLAISVTLFVVSALAVVYVYFKIKKIRSALAFMETTSLFIKQIWTSLLLPLAFLLIFVVYILYALYWSLLFFTLGEAKTDSESPFALIWPDAEGWAFLILHLVGTFVNLAFVACSYLFILNAACSFWYFSTPVSTAAQDLSVSNNNPASSDTETKKTTPKIYPIWQATKIFWNYHVGSVVVGSVLISLFSWFNYLFSHIYNKIAHWRDFAEAGSFKKTLLTIALALFYFYEKFIRYISRSAFSQITITGNPFYTASKDAFNLIQRNPNAYYPIQGVGDFIILLGEIFVILATTTIAFLGCLEIFGYSLMLSLEVTAVVFLIAFFACNLTMLIYSSVNEAVLMNYLLDVEIEINNYGKSKPYHAPAPLKSFLDDPQHQKDLAS